MKKSIPGCLYWMIRLLITSEGKDYQSLDRSSTCKSLAAEWQVISIAQDIIHCSSNSHTKLPKLIGLARCVHHLTSLCLRRVWHCCTNKHSTWSVSSTRSRQQSDFHLSLCWYVMFCQKKKTAK